MNDITREAEIKNNLEQIFQVSYSVNAVSGKHVDLGTFQKISFKIKGENLLGEMNEEDPYPKYGFDQENNRMKAVLSILQLIDKKNASAYSLMELASEPGRYVVKVDSNLINLDALRETVANLKMKKDAYTQGATVGLLKDIFPPDVSRIISSKLDKFDGANVGIANKRSHHAGKTAIEEFDNSQEKKKLK